MQTSGRPCREIADAHPAVIPGRAKREPGIHRAEERMVKWIPGLRQVAHLRCAIAHRRMTNGESVLNPPPQPCHRPRRRRDPVAGYDDRFFSSIAD
jgi:hypothetical protein